MAEEEKRILGATKKINTKQEKKIIINVYDNFISLPKLQAFTLGLLPKEACEIRWRQNFLRKVVSSRKVHNMPSP